MTEVKDLDVKTLEYVRAFVKNERDFYKRGVDYAKEEKDKEDEIYWKSGAGALNMVINLINELIREQQESNDS